ncbi:biotin--[acetyl-CoA-carboxylase] ligase [Virgibacillus halophilus]|uniref:biotin--[acetyl-CoA-carboxylase] ligase n=1 Tax=Tigheibacillus halophilus TaxID=361280 RepID=UPI003629B3F1
MQSTRNKLIELLAKNQHEYISGQELSEQLQVSRSAVWKHMKQLEKDGYRIEGVSNKGYRILTFPQKISENTLQWGLDTKWIGKSIIHRQITSSTQDVAHQAAIDGAPHGTVIIADEQTSGKGRMQRQWFSAANKGIWMSILLRPQIPLQTSPQLTLLCGTVLAATFEKELNVRPFIKWPNDILINEKKVAGILTEMQAEQDRIQYVVVGIGINVNQEKKDFPEEIAQKASSLKMETGTSLDLHKMIQEILKRFEKMYDQYMQAGFAFVKALWEGFGFKIGKDIIVRTMNNERKTAFLGIAEDGALLVKNDQGEKEKLYAGEIEWFKKEE